MATLEDVDNFAALAIEPRLPCELERLIFEDVARIERGSIPSLLLVCKRVKNWIEPALYSVVIRDDGAPPYSPSVRQYSPPIARLSSYAHHVRALLVYWEIEEIDLREHLKLCRNLTNLAIWCSVLFPGVLQLLEELPDLRRLVIDLPCIFPDSKPPYDLNHPVFHRLTHLELNDDNISWGQVTGLEDLENLTHLALNNVNHESIVWDFAKNCPNLKVLAVLDSEELNEHKFESESRVVVAYLSYSEARLDWIASAEGRECFWDHAKEKVQ